MEAENGTSRSLFDSRSRRRLGSDDSRRGGPFSQEARVVKRKLTTSFGVFAVLAGMAVAVPSLGMFVNSGLKRPLRCAPFDIKTRANETKIRAFELRCLRTDAG